MVSSRPLNRLVSAIPDNARVSRSIPATKLAPRRIRGPSIGTRDERAKTYLEKHFGSFTDCKVSFLLTPRAREWAVWKT